MQRCNCRTTWLLNGKQLDLNKNNIKKLPDGIMVNNAGAADEGKYQCLATNQYGTSLSQLLTVKLARKLLYLLLYIS